MISSASRASLERPKGSRPVVSAFEKWQHIGIVLRIFGARIKSTWVKKSGKLPRILHHLRASNPSKSILVQPRKPHDHPQCLGAQAPTIPTILRALALKYEPLKVSESRASMEVAPLGGGGCGGCGCSTCCLMTNTSAGAQTPHSEIDASRRTPEPQTRKGLR